MTTRSAELLDASTLHVLRAVDKAAHLADWIRQHGVTALNKQDRTPLTIADLAAQAVISRALEEQFPGDPLLAEEDGSALQTAPGQALVAPLLHHLQPFLPGVTLPELSRLLNRGVRRPGLRTWMLDPVDGTKGFLRDGGHYVVALALIEAGRPMIGMLGCPTIDADGRSHDASEEPSRQPHGSLFLARRDAGAWVSPLDAVDFVPIHVSAISTMQAARVLVSMAAAHIDAGRTDVFMRMAGVERSAVRMDSQAKHALIAVGQADVFVRIPADTQYREQVWDHAAGTLIVEEAGGRVTDLDGHPLDFNAGTRLLRNEGILVSNGRLHGAALQALRTARLHQP
jgi:3'(2'), 5'-bisphosphate nucleotidase